MAASQWCHSWWQQSSQGTIVGGRRGSTGVKDWLWSAWKVLLDPFSRWCWTATCIPVGRKQQEGRRLWHCCSADLTAVQSPLQCVAVHLESWATNVWKIEFQIFLSSWMVVRAVQLRVNSGTTRVIGLRWNIGFSLCAVPLLSFLFHISEMSKEDWKRTRDDKELLKSIFKLKSTVEYLRVYIQRWKWISNKGK